MHKGIVVDVNLGELESLIRDSQKLSDIKTLYEKSQYPTEAVRVILGIEDKNDGN